MAEFKCHGCDKPCRANDLKYDLHYCLDCWIEHLKQRQKHTAKELRKVRRLKNVKGV